MEYPEVENRRKVLRSLKARIDGGDQPVLDLYRHDIEAIGADAGLGKAESVRLLKRLVDGQYIRVAPGNEGPYTEIGGVLLVQVEDLTDRGLREIGVLPPTLDSVDGLVAALDELARRIQADTTVDEVTKDRKVSAVRGLMHDIRQAAMTVGTRELMEQFSRVFSGP